MGAGNSLMASKEAMASTGTCWNPLDVTCWLQNAAQWIAQQIMNALQPVVTALLQNPLSILTQTPAADTYSNPTVITWWTSFLGVVGLALGCMVVIGGYNVMVGRYLGLRHSELVEFLPRLLLAFGAASFSLYFLGLFIDLENALCAEALNLAGTSILTNLILSVFQGNLLGEGLLVWLLAVVLGGMAILLGIQMAVRLLYWRECPERWRTYHHMLPLLVLAHSVRQRDHWQKAMNRAMRRVGSAPLVGAIACLDEGEPHRSNPWHLDWRTLATDDT